MTNEQIEAIALANGFKLKEQPDGSMALNPYVFEFARALVEPMKELAEERDALAAWKDDAMRELVALQAVTHSMAHNGDMCWDYSRDAKAVIDRAPSQSLDRRDARMKAEALEDFAACYEVENDLEQVVMDHLRDGAKAYRKQAEGES